MQQEINIIVILLREKPKSLIIARLEGRSRRKPALECGKKKSRKFGPPGANLSVKVKVKPAELFQDNYRGQFRKQVQDKQ